MYGLIGSVTERSLNLDRLGPEEHYHVTTLGKLLTHVPLFTK